MLVKEGTGHALLSEGNNLLPKPMMASHQWDSFGIHLRVVLLDMFELCLKIAQ